MECRVAGAEVGWGSTERRLDSRVAKRELIVVDDVDSAVRADASSGAD